MPFNASAPSPAASTPNLVTNDGWWPDLDLDAAREAMRLDGTVTPARLRDALRAGMLDVNTDGPVAAWAAAHRAAGAATLADVDAPKIDEVSRLVYLYGRAAYSFAKADLVERYVDYDTSASGIKRGELQECAPDEHRRNGRWAISQLLGRSRSTVELI